METTRSISTPTPAATTEPRRGQHAPVASWAHTDALVAIFLALAAFGAAARGGARAPGAGAAAGTSTHAGTYVSLILAEWALAYYVWKVGLRRTRTPVRALVGGRWRGAADVARDVALGAALWLTWIGFVRLMPAVDGRAVRAVVPTSGGDAALWIVLAVSAGIVEELVFRGYFQRQFAALTRRAWAGLVLQALLFGVAHGYQGGAAVLRIALYGALFGAVALWRGSLRPGMIAHAWTDVAAGLLRG